MKRSIRSPKPPKKQKSDIIKECLIYAGLIIPVAKGIIEIIKMLL